MGAWFEARVLKIVSPVTKHNGDANGDAPLSSSSQDFDLPSYLYHIAFDG